MDNLYIAPLRHNALRTARKCDRLSYNHKILGTPARQRNMYLNVCIRYIQRYLYNKYIVFRIGQCAYRVFVLQPHMTVLQKIDMKETTLLALFRLKIDSD